jgi:DNA-binding transcriptional LysR family regulator
MNEKDIEMLLTLYKEKNITKTSEKLYMTQPAITRRIKKLEEEFNTELIIRTSKGIIFTFQGEKLISHAKKLKKDILNMRDDVSSSLNEIRGSLRLGVSSIFAHYELPDLLKGFLENHKKIDLSIQADHSSKIFKLLQSDEISAGIIRGEHSWIDKKILLSNEPICLAYNRVVSFDELSNLSYIQYKTDSYLQYQLAQWWNERYIEQPRIGITTSSIDTCLELVKRGIGWSILPYMGLKKYDGYLEKLSWKDGTAFERKTWLFYKEEYLQLPVVAAFIQYVKSYEF